MVDQPEILDFIREYASKNILFLPHAVRQMSNPDRMISTKIYVKYFNILN